MKREWWQRTIGLLIAFVLAVGTTAILSGCEKKSKPEKVGEEVGEAVEETGEHLEKAAEEAAGK